jgi:hypothetical protein
MEVAQDYRPHIGGREALKERSLSYFFSFEITLPPFLSRSFKSIHVALRLWP